MESRFRMYFKIFLTCLKFRKKIALHELDSLYEKWQCFVLSSVGLWPYQSRFSKRMSYGCFLASSLSIIVALIAGLTDKWCTDPLIILETNLAVMYVGIGVIACTVLYYQEDKMKKLYEKLANDWKEITDKRELRILKAFHRQGLAVTFAMLVYAVPVFLIFGALTFLPGLKIVTAMKEYNHVFPYYYSRMIIIESMHFYQVVAHSSISFIYSSLCYMAIGCTFISSVKHICAIYVIVGCKLGKVENCKRKVTLHRSRRNRIMISKLITVVNKHTDAIHGVYLIEGIFSTGFLIMEVLAIFAIALVMADLMCSNDDPVQFLRAFLISGTFCFYIFHINFAAQQVIQVSNDITTSAYFVDWLSMSIEARQLLCMIITRSCKTEQLTAGSIFPLSNMNYASFLKTCWTIATVLLSSQRRLRHTYA